jgi:hypothetical protein
VIEGGYVRSGGSNEIWTKSSATADETNITFSGAENAPGSNNSIRHIVAFKSDAKTDWTVKDLNITTANTPASTYANDGRGMSNYGFLIINSSSNYTISRCNVLVGNAGNGLSGTTPAGSGGAGGGGTGRGGSGGTSGGSAPGAGTKGDDGNGGALGGNGGSSTGSSSAGCTVCACGCNRQGGGQNGSGGANAGAAVTSYTAGAKTNCYINKCSLFHSIRPGKWIKWIWWRRRWWWTGC